MDFYILYIRKNYTNNKYMIYKKIKLYPANKRNILLQMYYFALSQYSHIYNYHDFYAYFTISLKHY